VISILICSPPPPSFFPAPSTPPEIEFGPVCDRKEKFKEGLTISHAGNEIGPTNLKLSSGYSQFNKKRAAKAKLDNSKSMRHILIVFHFCFRCSVTLLVRSKQPNWKWRTKSCLCLSSTALLYHRRPSPSTTSGTSCQRQLLNNAAAGGGGGTKSAAAAEKKRIGETK
jgi:hypothetical protein